MYGHAWESQERHAHGAASDFLERQRTVSRRDVGAAVAGGLQALVLVAADLGAEAGDRVRDDEHLRGGATHSLRQRLGGVNEIQTLTAAQLLWRQGVPSAG